MNCSRLVQTAHLGRCKAFDFFSFCEDEKVAGETYSQSSQLDDEKENNLQGDSRPQNSKKQTAIWDVYTEEFSGET